MTKVVEQERFYGRRVGRKSAIRRQFIETHLSPFSLSAADLTSVESLQDLFSDPVSHVWLEIGFGAGEHLIQQLLDHPEVGMIGVEPFQDGMAHVLKKAKTHPLIERRLRLIQEDIRLFLPLFPEEAFLKIFVLFSDPWPKKRHHKRRLIQASFLERCASLLKKGGQLLLAHDHSDYIEEMWGLLKAQNKLVYHDGIRSLDCDDWPSWPTDWPMTRYGQKALAQGRRLAFFVWEKPQAHV